MFSTSYCHLASHHIIVTSFSPASSTKLVAIVATDSVFKLGSGGNVTCGYNSIYSEPKHEHRDKEFLCVCI